MSYAVFLANVGNPDFGQDPERPVYGTTSGVWKEIDDIDAAGPACRDYIEAENLGGGNWTGGFIRDLSTDEIVGYVSYNGRRKGMDDEYVPHHLMPEGYALAAPKP